jgi:hypothetical protein
MGNFIELSISYFPKGRNQKQQHLRSPKNKMQKVTINKKINKYKIFELFTNIFNFLKFLHRLAARSIMIMFVSAN